MNSLIGFAIAYALIIATIAGGAALQRYGRIPAIRSNVAKSLVQLVLLLLIPGIAALVTYISYTDYNSRSTLVANGEQPRPPLAMALADGAIVMFGILVLPTPHYAGLGRLAHLSYERLVWIHLVSSLLMIGLMVAHWVAMTRLNDDGLLVLIFSVIAAVPALFRRYKYAIFRYTHVAGNLAFVFMIIHAPRSLIMLVPGLVLYLVDLFQRFRWFRGANAKIQSLHFNPKNDLIELVVTWNVNDNKLQPPAAAQFGLIVIPEISYVPHPFSVALCTKVIASPDAGRNADVQPEAPAAASATSAPPPPADDIRAVTFYIRKTTGEASWTSRLASLASAPSSVPPSWPALVLTGFHGELTVPLAACSHVVLVAGGIGITPMMHIIDTLCEACLGFGSNNCDDQPMSPFGGGAAPTSTLALGSSLKSVTVCWVSRHMEDVEQLGPLMRSRLVAAAGLSCRSKLKFFCTKTNAPVESDHTVENRISAVEMSDAHCSGNQSREVDTDHGFEVTCGRPSWSEEMLQASQFILGDDPLAVTQQRVGCYVCGPDTLMSAAGSEAERLGFMVHKEAFEM